jgi:uncharacterized membrane protein SpoIIM required for sporulation
MNLSRFESEHQAVWSEIEDLVVLAGNRPENLGADRVRRLAMLYRSAAADLAYARRHFGFDPIVDRLEGIVGSARVLVYERPERSKTAWRYLSTGYWQSLFQRRSMLRLTVAVFFGAALFGLAVAEVNPDGIVRLLPEGFLWVTEEQNTDTGLGIVGLAGFSLFVMINNITVTIFAFLLGIAWGLGTFWSISYNGFILGALTSLAVAAGNGEVLVAAVVGHGILEISCIMVGGAAGFAMGRAVLAPGHLSRVESMRREGTEAFRLALGTAPWLVLAGFVEGYLSRIGLGWEPTLIAGIIIGAVFWGLYFWRGRVPVTDVLSTSPVYTQLRSLR